MTSLLGHSWIVATSSSTWQQLGGGLRGRRAKVDASDMLTLATVIVCAAVGIWLLSRWMSRNDTTRTYNSPRALFRDLSKAHGLDFSSRRLLMRLSRWQRLAQPARLFLEPDRFLAANVGPFLSSQQPRLDAIRDRVFGAELKDMAEFR